MSGPERTMVPKVGTPATNLLRFLFLALGTLASLSQAQLEVHIPAGLTKLQALEGSEALLPAWYVTTASKLEDWGSPLLFWFLEQKGKKDQKQILAYINGALTRSPRASLAYSMPSQNVSLLLQALEEKDSGTYRVSVDVQDSQGKNHHSTKTIELDVLVPPSPPSCNLRGVPRVGTNMTLTCHSSRSKPEVLYQWERLTPSSQVFFAPALDAAAGSLKLTNLSTSMSGVYVCKASNVVGTVQCNVTLEVITGPSVGVVAGAIVGSLVGLVLLVGLVFLYQRRKKVLEDVPNDIKEDAFAPRTLPWTKSIDTISKNGTLSSVTSSRTLQPSHASPKPGTLSSTPSLSRQVQSLPKMPTLDGPQPQPEYQNLHGVPPNNLIRKGAVPVMVPAQNKIGSLV